VHAVLVIGGDWPSRRGVIAAIRYGGFETDTVGTTTEATRRLRRRRYVAVIVDLGDRPATAAEIAGLRAQTDAAIVVATPAADRVHTIECLDAGADDCVARPVDPEELLARVRAVLRRTTASEPEPPVITDDFAIELSDRRALRPDGAEITLSPIEWRLVETLARRAGHLVTREELLTSVWGPNAVRKTQYLRVHMASIRQKLEPDHAHPRYFVTAPGLGIKFDPTPAAHAGTA